MKLSSKLFFILLGITATMALIAMGLARYSFQQGFLEFVGGLEKVRLQQIAQVLVIEYEDNNNEWTWLNDRNFDRFMGPSQERDVPRQNTKGPENRPRGPGGRRDGSPPPPPLRPPGPERLDRGPQNSQKRLAPATAVFDSDGVLIAGNNNSKQLDTVFHQALVSQGKTIGELRSWPNVESSSELTYLFARQQFWSSIAIIVFCLIFAGLVSWLLSRKLLKPIHQLRYSIAKLNAGKYGESVSSKRNDELGELMNNVDSLSDTLAKNRSAKNRMFADISHELRTPLTVLAGEIDLLKAGIRPFDQKQILSLEQESDRLRHLVEDLYQLSLSDVGALKYSYVKADLSACLHKAVNSMQHHLTDKNIEVSTNIPTKVFVEIDENRIEQLFLNILMNAGSYTDNPGRIDIALVATKESAEITIMDSAPGVTPQDCEKLFEPLFRVDESRTRRESGAGLGLAICKNIVAAHNGSITASPSTLGGVKMHISLPITRAAI